MLRIIILSVLLQLVVSFNIQPNFPTFLQPQDQASPTSGSGNFFGYNLNIGQDRNNNTNFLIGAPRAEETIREPAKLHRCSNINFDSPFFPCSSVTPPRDSGNLTGLSLNTNENQNIQLCYPSKVFPCADVQIQPGFCHQTDNDGRWKNTYPNDTERVCPTVSNSTLDLIFLLDGSGSVGETNFGIVRNWVINVSRNFDISDRRTQIGVLQYSTYDRRLPFNRLQRNFRVEVRLGSETDRERFETRVSNIRYLTGATYTARALNFSVSQFRRSERYNMNSTNSKVLVLLTDGNATLPELLNDAARYVRRLGIKVFAIGVGDANVAQLRLIATGTNSDTGVFFVNDFSALSTVTDGLRTGIRDFALEGSSNSGSSNSSESNTELELGEVGFSIANKRGNNVSTDKIQLNLFPAFTS